jgi:hypothetical protein
MLGLELRQEFKGKRLKGTAIELSNDSNTGATQIAAQEFLRITYPTHDLLKGIEAIGPDQGRPVVVIGERGLGKSHLLAALHHAVNDPVSTGSWLDEWATTLNSPQIRAIQLRSGMQVIGESLHRQRYKFLWDLLFERHPYGTYIKGKWEGMGESKTDIPSDELILEMLRHTPTMLLLDEFQTWFDGLTNTKQFPWKNWAFNFIQILSEIAKEHPDLLVLVISVRNGLSDAYQQVHRVNPIAIDFMAGGNPERVQQDRRRMLLHRLFINRLHIRKNEISSIVSDHVAEYLRLLNVPTADHERVQKQFLVSWPFAPHLLRLLEEQVLIATDAQETRDMIRILAALYKSRGETSPVLTAADFRLDDDSSGIGALLDSVSNEHHRTLRAKAQQNIIAVKEVVPAHSALAPHLAEIVGALWLRSIAVGNLAGAEPATLQVDITRSKRLDDNQYQVELSTIIENSFNIHQEGNRLVFKEEENPRAKLMACARNDKLFADGSDQFQLARQIRYVIGGTDEVAKSSRVIVLPKSWQSDPWTLVDESEHPDRWDERLPILILPEEPDNIDVRLGHWIKDHLQRRRNTIRFLLPKSGSVNAFQDRDLLVLTRAEMKANEWSNQNPEYRKLHNEYQGILRDHLKKRFDRFALLSQWNFSDPSQCRFSIETLSKQGSQILEGIEEVVVNDLFVPEDFEELCISAASESKALGQLLKELQEPRPTGQECIPWLGETGMKERVVQLCARGKIAINVRGLDLLQSEPGEDRDAAWKRLRPRLAYTGRQLDEVFLLAPSATTSTGGSSPESTPIVTSGGVGGLFDQPTDKPPMPAEKPATWPPGTNPTGGIFGGGRDPAIRSRVQLSNPATSPLNLIGKLEGWGIGPATRISDVSIKVSDATGDQLKELLKKLPDGMTFELSLEKEDAQQ